MATHLDTIEIPDLLASLVERSIVSFDQETGRYQLSESMKSFAVAAQEGEEEEAISRRLFDYFFERIVRLSEGLEPTAPAIRDIDNARTCLEWGLRAPGKEVEVMRMAVNLVAIWNTRYHAEGRKWIIAAKERALGGRQTLGAEQIRLGRAEVQLGMVELRLGRLEDANATLKRAEAIALDLGDLKLIAQVEVLRVTLSIQAGDLLQGRELADAFLTRARADGFELLDALTGMGEVSRLLEDWEAAEGNYEEVAGMERNDAKRYNVANLGFVRCRLGKLDSSRELFTELFQMSRLLQHDLLVSFAAIGLGYVSLSNGDVDMAGRLCGFGLNLAKDSYLESPDQKDVDWIIARGREIGGAKFEAAMEEGSRLTLEDVRLIVQEMS